jgi:hypothetical protein
MLHSFIEKYVGARLIRATANLAKFYVTIPGVIKTVRVRAPSVNFGTHYFSFLKNGVAQYTPLGNMIQITPGVFGEKLNQNIAVAIGDVLQFDAAQVTTGDINQPIFFEVVIDDQLPARESVEIETASLADDAEEQGQVTIGKVAVISEMAADRACRVRLYRTTEYRDADEERPVGEDPTGDHGLIVECVFASAGSLNAKQVAIASDDEDPRTGEVAYAIQNLSGSTAEVLVTIPHLVLER